MWYLRKSWTLIGSDVVPLFPSLSAERTPIAVRAQAMKSDIKWENIEDRRLRLYIYMNKNLASDISKIEHLLPSNIEFVFCFV